MKLIVGLGNPGKKYEKTRHNVGFLAVDYFRESDPSVSEWKRAEKWKAEVAEGSIGKEKMILMKPQTYMNASGLAVGAAKRFHRLKPEDIWIIHDEIDLPLGTFRIKRGGSSAGHKGAASIIESIGPDFIRLRIGIQASEPSSYPAESFVLKKFSSAEIKTINQVIMTASEAIQTGLQEGVEQAMNKYNRSKKYE